MLYMGIMLSIVVVLLAIDEIRLRKRIAQLEQHLSMWQLAAERLTKDNERMSRELMG